MLKISLIFTRREIEVIKKKMVNKKLTQQDSNCLSKFVRPKLKEIQSINAKLMLDKLEYSRKSYFIEKKLKKIILNNIPNIVAIILYGSAVQTNYQNYKDIDIIVIVRKRFWKKLGEKYKEIVKIKNILLKEGIEGDIQIYDKKAFLSSYPHNISLIYQLKDRKVIYGKLMLPSKLEIYKQDIGMKIDYSILEDEKSEGVEIYKAIRNLMLIKLILNKIIDNQELVKSLNEELGKGLAERLKNNQELKEEKIIALSYLKRLMNLIILELKNAKWEKITL